ncbi:probable ATP-dependent RNA helicase ddx17 [Paramacrobiotus metropolitanus]|uniref:probable ATP-dependent RNA helicase ddx17 n=1 Tax=Paramacrobiotus metropolitanus TaxID=2943436 RepID=UPI002445FCF9|nr:probable ATP-dependent RNA helicase ddx17 [Paramacrobiotus metropolitanus]
MMHRLLVALLLAAILPLALGSTGGSSGSSGSGGATNGQVQLNIQQATALDDGNHNSVGQSQNIASGTSLSIGGGSSSSLQYDPTVTAKPAAASGSNYVNAYGNAQTGVLQNNQNSQSNSTSNGQHHNVISQSQVIGNGTGMSMSNSASGSLYLANPTSTTPYPTRYPCQGVTCYGYGCTIIENGYSCYCSCPYIYTPTYYYDYTTYPSMPSPAPPAPAPHAVDQRQRKPAPSSNTKGRNVQKGREKAPARGKAQANNGHTSKPHNSRSKA